MPSSPKTNGQRLVVKLKLSSARLRAFSSSVPAGAAAAAAAADMDNEEIKDKDQIQIKVDEASSPPSSTSGDAPPPASSVDNASDAPSTPATGDGGRRKSMPGSRGTKRGLNQTGDLTSKLARSKPGPKKRQKLDDGSFDSSKLGSAAHKLGPKANQGAINAGLRALDRTGAPCRKWERKTLQLKSFTGVIWDVTSWRSPKPPPKSPETTEDATPSEAAVNGVAMVNGDSHQASSAVPSEKSNLGEAEGDGDLTPLPAASAAQSPTPAIAMTA